MRSPRPGELSLQTLLLPDAALVSSSEHAMAGMGGTEDVLADFESPSRTADHLLDTVGGLLRFDSPRPAPPTFSFVDNLAMS